MLFDVGFTCRATVRLFFSFFYLIFVVVVDVDEEKLRVVTVFFTHVTWLGCLDGALAVHD